MAERFIVTGTDTDVGKTIVAAGLTAVLETSYWKPIQAGLAPPTDSERVAQLTGAGADRILPEAYRLNIPCSPHQAARADGITIEKDRLTLPPVSGRLIVEGAGGVMVPVNSDTLLLDLFAMWNLPVVLVARTLLGTINHSLLSLHALRGRGLIVAGVIFVGDENAASEEAIVRLGRVEHLGRLPWLDRLEARGLAAAVHHHLRLERLT